MEINRLKDFRIRGSEKSGKRKDKSSEVQGSDNLYPGLLNYIKQDLTVGNANVTI